MALLVASVEGDEQLELHADELDKRLERFRPHLAKRLVTNLRHLEPHGPGQGLAAGTRAFVHGQTVRVGIFGVPYARAQDRGAYIVARGADSRHPGASGPAVLAFEVEGKTVFARHVRLRGSRYFQKHVAAAPAVVELTYDRDFDLDRHAD